MKDVIARERIEGLDKLVRELKSNQHYYAKNEDGSYKVYPTDLPAYEIIQRFSELYDFLGIERVTELPSTKLRKKGLGNT